jgi:transposase
MDDQKRFIGIDMSKRSFEVAIVSNADPRVLRKKYKATHEGRQEFISSLRKNDVLALETGNSSFVLAKLVQKQVGCRVHVLNAGKLHIIFKSLKKTDKEDALKIAKFVQRIPEKELPTVTIPSDEEMAMRSSATEHIRVDSARTQSINALHSLLWNNGITGFGRNDLRYKKNRDKVIDNLPEEYRAQGIRLLKLIDVYEQCLGEIEEEQKESLNKHRDESTISLSMPGIGPKTAFVILAYLGNMERFSNCRQVGYFSGFTPSTDISGQQEQYGPITKQGPKQLRRVMNQAAWAAVRSQDGIILREFYDRVRSTKGKKKAIVAVGRKMLEILYVLHIRKELYQSPVVADHSRIIAKLKRSGLIFE